MQVYIELIFFSFISIWEKFKIFSTLLNLLETKEISGFLLFFFLFFCLRVDKNNNNTWKVICQKNKKEIFSNCQKVPPLLRRRIENREIAMLEISEIRDEETVPLFFLLLLTKFIGKTKLANFGKRERGKNSEFKQHAVEELSFYKHQLYSSYYVQDAPTTRNENTEQSQTLAPRKMFEFLKVLLYIYPSTYPSVFLYRGADIYFSLRYVRW